MRSPFPSQLKAILIFALSMIPQFARISCAQVVLELPNVIEVARKFSDSGSDMRALPNGGLLRERQDSTGVLLTNDLVANPSFNPGLLQFPVDSYPSGGFVCRGDLSHFVWRLDASGARVDSFVSPPITTNDMVGVIAAQPDGKVLVGGSFRFGGPSIFSNGLIRLNTDGSVDGGFQHDSSTRYAERLVLLADGKFLCLGQRGFLLFLPDGQMDATFHTGVINGSLDAIVVERDGSILIGGGFTSVDGVARSGLARLTSNGSVDFRFAADTRGGVIGIQLQSDGRIVANIATAVYRFFSDGRRDSSFSRLQSGDAIHAIAVDAADRIYVGDDSGLVQQFSGRVRIRVPQSNRPLVLERSSLIDSGWAAVPAPQIGNWLDFVPDFPGTGNSFYRARPPQ